MDRAWAVDRLRGYILDIDKLPDIHLWGEASAMNAVEELIVVEPVMRDVMNAAQPGLGNYPTPRTRHGFIAADETEMSYYEKRYWTTFPKRNALRAIGALTFGEEARERLRPDAPDLQGSGAFRSYPCLSNMV